MTKFYSKLFVAVVTISCLAVVVEAASASLDFWYGNIPENIRRMERGEYCPIREFNIWVNEIFIPKSISAYLTQQLGEDAGYYAITYLRDLFTGSCVYWGAAAFYHVMAYVVFLKPVFTDARRPLPTTAIMLDSMMLAQSSMFVYAALPVFSTFLIENKVTKVYFYIDEIGGWQWYGAAFLAYMTLVEIGIYWMHRVLHTNKTLYKYIHSLHHKYNSAATLTPWASVAFHPIDGILQASPYVACLFIIPCHYFTHVGMVFFTAVWATNIHDSMWGDTEPIMGSKYHLLHHTHYHYNYGQFFIFCDYFWGTLRLPEKRLLNPAPLGMQNEEADKLASFTNDTSDDVMLKVMAVGDVKGKKMN